MDRSLEVLTHTETALLLRVAAESLPPSAGPAQVQAVAELSSSTLLKAFAMHVSVPAGPKIQVALPRKWATPGQQLH